MLIEEAKIGTVVRLNGSFSNLVVVDVEGDQQAISVVWLDHNGVAQTAIFYPSCLTLVPKKELDSSY